MQRFLSILVLVTISTRGASIGRTDDADTVPEVVYIDPTPYLPEGMNLITREGLENVPLEDLVAHVEEHYGIRVVLLENDLADEGVDSTDETFLPAGLPLYQALDVALEDVNGAQLTWIMEDSLLKITTETAAGDIEQLESFDVSHLGIGESDIDLMNWVPRGMWFPTDGFGGNAVLVGNSLIVRQQPVVNREVAVLFDALSREGRIIRVEHPPHHQRLFETLDVVVDIEFESEPLETVAAQLEELTGVPFRFHVSELADEGVQPSSLVTYHFGPRPLRDVLKHMLADVNGSWVTAVVNRGAICITTATAAGDDYEIVLYDVRDLLPYASAQRVRDLMYEHTSGHWHTKTALANATASRRATCWFARKVVSMTRSPTFCDCSARI